MNAPLAGLVVLDFSELLPGPFMTQALVEMGAQVIKIERPPHGDPARRMAAGVFAAVNRGKSSILVDLKTSDGRERARELVATADVLVESFRPGTLARFGLDYEAVCEGNPRLIYVSLSGYGQSGPDAQLPGHDINYLAASGALALTGEDGGAPASRLPLPFADLGGSMLALSSMLAALYQRERTGAGQYVDVALADSMLHWMTPRLAAFRDAGKDSLDAQRAGLTRPAYGTFKCADGRYITLGALETPFFRSVVNVLGLQPYAAAEWDSFARRTSDAAAINQAIADAIGHLGCELALRRMRAADIPVMEVLSPADLPSHAQHVARQAFVDTRAGPVPRYPVRLQGMPPTPTAPCVLDGGVPADRSSLY